jgi:hypothetical protein
MNLAEAGFAGAMEVAKSPKRRKHTQLAEADSRIKEPQ